VDNRSQFGSNFKKLLGMHGLNSQEGARIIHSTPQTIASWTSGRRMPSTNALLKIAEVFEVDAVSLVSQPFEHLLPTLSDPVRYQAAQKRIAKHLRRL
jgi:transcriptional regulator with XRE-family HTH domain